MAVSDSNMKEESYVTHMKWRQIKDLPSECFGSIKGVLLNRIPQKNNPQFLAAKVAGNAAICIHV